MRLAALAPIVTSFVIASSTPRAAVLPQAPAPVTIPFELATRHVVVKATVNKSRPLAFVLDTGASRAIVRWTSRRSLACRSTDPSGRAARAREASRASW